MKTLNTPHPAGMPMSARRHSSQQELAVLTRANHDMRSPLSVMLGVFELLEDAGSLTDSERRYLQLGMKAADELLSLADGLRLYSAMERDLVNVDATPVDLWGMATEHFQASLGAKGVRLESGAVPTGHTRALGDEGYLKIALTSLAKHLAANLPHSSTPERPAMCLRGRNDEPGWVALQVAPCTSATTDDLRRNAVTSSESLEHEELGLLNGVRLIELMGGSVRLTPQVPSLLITLPAVPANVERS